MCGELIKVNSASDLCEKCEKEVRYIEEPYCIKCGEPLSDKHQMICSRCVEKTYNYDRAMGIFVHDGVVKESIYNYKFKNYRINADFYVNSALKLYGDWLRRTKIDVIIPVPVHKSRERERGYNQATVFGKKLAEKTGIQLKDNILCKREKTKSQKKLSESLRFTNLKKAFEVNDSTLKGITDVLLVDDIYTTGSTVDACSMVLKEHGVNKVYVLCISRGVDINYDKKA